MDGTIIFCFIIAVLLYIQLITLTGRITPVDLVFVLFALIPCFLLVLLKIAEDYLKWKKTSIISILAPIIPLSIFYFALLSGIIFIGSEMFPDGPETPSAYSYSGKVRNLKRYAGFEHFPNQLPDGISDYHFQIDRAMNDNTHYVKFNINKQYIENIMKEYGSKCIIFTDKENFDKYDITIYPDEITDADKICILHKASFQDNAPYTSGIAIYNTNTIYFFLADYI
ncbi:MAG: hypothetical protein PHX18_04650 [Candidatus Gastranaerophilales bacterium]|nr:hypothetical protein [Candidatus Gastranaerophilales bacterium]